MKIRAKRKVVYSNDDEVNRLERELREAQSTIKTLKKRLSRHDKRYVEKEQEESTPKVKKEFDCPDCRRADLDDIVIAGRLFSRCPICGYRTKAKKI